MYWIIFPTSYKKNVLKIEKKNYKPGRIVYVSSQAGQTGVYGYTAYSASKFALRGLAETLHMEVNHLGIGVTISFPPDTQTPGFDEESKTSFLN